MSFLKYADRPDITRGNGRGPVSFARASEEGAPFRGEDALLRPSERDLLCETVYDVHVAVFDLGKEEDAKRYQEILDRTVNGWYRILHVIRRWVAAGESDPGRILVYVEWAEAYREVDKRRLSAGADR